MGRAFGICRLGGFCGTQGLRWRWAAGQLLGQPAQHQHLQLACSVLTTRGFAMRLPRRSFYREVPEGLKPIPLTIVGRPNVGKSTLFNRLLSGTKKKKGMVSRSALTSDRAGTTRDRKDSVAVFGGMLLRVIDTGGLEGEAAVRDNSLLASMREHVWRAVAEAEVVLFVIDAREGVTPLDIEIAGALRKNAGSAAFYRQNLGLGAERDSVPVILIANKAEGAFIGPYLNDSYDLGMGDPVVISAAKNEGMEELYDRLCMEVGHLQQEEEEEEEETEEETEEEAWGAEAEEEASGDELDPQGRTAEEAENQGPVPTLPWMPPTPLSEQQKRSLRWYAQHPSDPLGELDLGLKQAVLHRVKEHGKVPKYMWKSPQRALPDKESRDEVLQHRRMEEMEQPMRLSVVGTPSAGKSSIINALLQEERCIVDEADGTTMDAIVSDWNFKGQPLKLIDTCGVYKGWNHPGTDKEWLEPGMGTRKAIRKSHVVILCLDPVRSRKMTYWTCPSAFETRLGNFIAEEGKALVIAVNKWDLIAEEEQPKFREEILQKIADKMPDIKGVPVVFMSAKYNLNLSMLIVRAFSLWKRWSARLPTSKLNSWLTAWMIRWPPPWRHGQKCQVKYMTQTRARPPTFVLWTNTTSDGMPRNYLRQLQNSMREEFRIGGIPMRFILRSTLMPKPRKKMSSKEILKWKRMGPKQAEIISDLNSKKMIRKPKRQTG